MDIDYFSLWLDQKVKVYYTLPSFCIYDYYHLKDATIFLDFTVVSAAS